MRIRVGHLYPDYLNIYADRGNIAVFTRRAALRGHELEVTPISIGDEVHPGEHDLLYVGGGQDREQALIAPDLAAKGPGIRAAVEVRSGAARGLRRLPAARARLSRPARRLPAGGRSLPARDRRGRTADDRRRAARVRARAGRAQDGRRLREPRRADAARPRRGGRSAESWPGSGTTASPGSRAAESAGRSGRTCTARSCREIPWLADWLLSQALAHATGGDPPELEPLADRLEAEAHAVSARRARDRGGRF